MAIKLDGTESIEEAKAIIAGVLDPVFADFTVRLNAALNSVCQAGVNGRAFHMEIQLAWDIIDRRPWL